MAVTLQRKNILIAILIAFLVTSILMGGLVYLFIVFIPNYCHVEQYTALSPELCKMLEENGISCPDELELIGGWHKERLSYFHDETKIVFRMPASADAGSFVSSEVWRTFDDPAYNPPAREREFGDYVFTKEASRIGGNGKLYMSEPQDGFVYYRMMLT